MLATLFQHAGNIVCTAIICLIAIGMGKLVLARAGIKDCDPGEWIIFSAATGFVILGYCIFTLSICQALYPAVIYIITGICGICAFAGWLTGKKVQIESSFAPDSELLENGNRAGRIADMVNKSCLIVLLIFLLACLMLVLTPDVGKDALIYHLEVPKLFLENHGNYFIPGNIFAHYPLFGEMLYILALGLKGDVAAKGIHFTITVLILFSMWKFGRRHISDSRFNFIALLIFFTIPSVFANAHYAYCDLTLTFYTFLAVYAFLNWFDTNQQLWIILCGVFSGIAVSTKYSGLFLPFTGCLAILWGCRRSNVSNKNTLQFFSLYILFTIITGFPFYLKNLIMTGNPLYPFFYQLFGGKGWSADQARYYDVFVGSLGMGREFIDYLLLPWNLSFHAQMDSPRFDGIIGPVFIIVLPFAIGMRKKIPVKMKIVLMYSIFAFCFWASSAQQVRYLMPVFPFLALMTGLIFSYYSKNKIILTLVTIAIVGGIAFNGYHIVNDFKKIRPLNVLAGREDKDAFLSRIIPSYTMIHHVNTHLPEDSYVFTIYMKNLGYLFNLPFYSDAMFESYTIETILNNAETPEDVRQAIEKMGFTHILYNIEYVIGKPSTFSEENKQFFMKFQNKYLKLLKSYQNRYFLFRVVKS